ncbi:MAG: HlyC/CorC family transporter [Planctomycetes bacterium]|nr:HlyC/CorC family transporter [Planctomycetota bacterium]NOG55173.1 HlyC/CorC family transporter [Planctomycetota bacterium]
MLGWTYADIPFLVTLPILLVASAFFSGSETAYFGLRGHERVILRRRSDAPARLARRLLGQPQMLLITLMLGNMLANVLFFVVSSVLLLRQQAPALIVAASSLAFLIILIVTAEVVPKLIATRITVGWISLSAVPISVLHGVLAPIRVVLGSFVIAPLLRLVAPPSAHRSSLSTADLASLLDLSTESGVINDEEGPLLGAIVVLGSLKVRDIMTPRVHMQAVSIDEPREVVIRKLSEAGDRIRLPVYEGQIDRVVGMLDIKEFLLHEAEQTPREALIEPTYVPEQATLDHLVSHFRTTHSKAAMVVDEYGQTAGVVTLDDLVDALARGSAPAAATGNVPADGDAPESIRRIAPGQWEINGNLSIHALSDAFDIHFQRSKASTVGGLIHEQLGRLAEPGDSIDLNGAILTVVTISGTRIETARLDVPEP